MFVPKVLLIYPALRSFVIVLLFRWRESLLVRPALRVMDFILGFLLVTWVIISWAPHALTHNFLVMLPFSSLSHKHVLDSIAEELVNSGHQVTLFSGFLDTRNISGITQVYLPKVDEELNRERFNFFMGPMLSLESRKAMLKMVGSVRNATYDSQEIQQLLMNEPSSKRYDLLIVDSIFNEFTLPIGHRLGIPTVYISPAIIYTPIFWNLNIPHPYAYLSSGLDYTDGRMSFGERFTNVISIFTFYFWRHWVMFEDHDAYIQSLLPGTPPLIELEKNVSFVMAHTHPGVHHSAPSMPYFTEIACCHCRARKRLPKHLDDFVNGSGNNGTIFFSLGSYTRGDMMPPEVLKKLLQGFAQLPQRVLFKYESELHGLPTNVQRITWAPQQDLLAHPKLRLFVTHGGGQSIVEAVYHACPVLVIPLSADQLGHASLAKIKRFGEYVDWRTFTEESLVHTIKDLLTNSMYEKNIQILSRRLRDQPMPATKKAVFWLEYVLRHQGAHHLKSNAEGLSVWQYFLLDVVVAMILVVAVTAAVVYMLLKTTVSLVGRIRIHRYLKKKLN